MRLSVLDHLIDLVMRHPIGAIWLAVAAGVISWLLTRTKEAA